MHLKLYEKYDDLFLARDRLFQLEPPLDSWRLLAHALNWPKTVIHGTWCSVYFKRGRFYIFPYES